MGTLAVGAKTLHGIKRVPQWSHIGSTEYNIGGKATVTLYTYINHHVGTPKKTQTSYYEYFWTKSSSLRYSNSSMEKLSKTNIMEAGVIYL